MNAEDLLDSIVNTVQEMQIKLGDADGTVSLYLPIASIGDEENLKKILEEFENIALDKLGKVSCQISGDRVNISVPPEGSRYVSTLPVSPVLLLMVRAVNERWNLDKLIKELNNLDSSFKIKEIIDNGEGFDHVIWFPDGMDQYVYCISTHFNHLTYHRFSRRDYEDFDLGALE